MQSDARKPLILDGSLGMELEKRGFHCRLPLWSAWALIEAPDLIRETHADYVRAGCEILTATTFRCTHHALAKAGLQERYRELTDLAVRLARETADETSSGREISIAGSMAPLEDCYQPELAPDDEILKVEHRRNAEALAEAGADILLVETQNSKGEALVATESALESRLPVWTALMPRSESEMFNGDSLIDTAKEIAQMGAQAILINCCSLEIATEALAALKRELPGMKLGVYPNDLEGLVSPSMFAEWAMTVQDQADIIGGCCGIGPEHLRSTIDNLRQP